MKPIKVLCVNPYPIASDCAIGTATEHLFNTSLFDVMEFYTADCTIRKCISTSYKININTPFAHKTNALNNTESAPKAITSGRKNLKARLKSVVKDIMPVYISRELKKEIDQFQPQIIYTHGYSSRILRLTTKISKYTNAPIVVHTLDFWFSKNKHTQKKQFRYIKKCFRRGTYHLCGSPKMVEFLKNSFDVRSQFISNCAPLSEPNFTAINKTKKIFSIGYIGNLTPNRHNSINCLYDAIQSSSLSDKIQLHIYTPKNQIAQFGSQLKPGIVVHDAVPPDKTFDLYRSFDFLLHAESFDKADIDFTRFSLSTKIAECLGTAKPLLCIGPHNIGVCDFLLRENVGICKEDPADIVAEIKKLIENDQYYIDICKHQFACAKSFFEESIVRNKLYNAFIKAINNDSNTVHYLSFFHELLEVPNRKREIAAQQKIRYIADSILSCEKDIVLVSSATATPGTTHSLQQEIFEHSTHETHIYLPYKKFPGKLSSLFLQFAILRYLLFSVKKGDVIVAYHAPLYILPLSICKRLKRNRFILEFNDLYSLHFANPKKAKKMNLKERKFLNMPDAYIFASPFMAELLTNPKPFVVNYGSYKTGYNITNPKSSTSNKLIIYTGVIETLRNAAYIVADSARFLPESCKIIIAGYGTEKNIKKLQNQISDINESISRTAVEYVGCLNPDELSKLMLSANLAINAHTYSNEEIWKSKYSFPSKIPLNMAHNLPIITYPYDIIITSPMKEACFFFEELTPNNLANCIVRALDNNLQAAQVPISIISDMNKTFISSLSHILQNDTQ